MGGLGGPLGSRRGFGFICRFFISPPPRFIFHLALWGPFSRSGCSRKAVPRTIPAGRPGTAGVRGNAGSGAGLSCPGNCCVLRAELAPTCVGIAFVKEQREPLSARVFGRALALWFGGDNFFGVLFPYCMQYEFTCCRVACIPVRQVKV